MKTYLLSASKQVDGILYLTIAPKTSGMGLWFYPGQYVTIGFRGANGRRSPMRCFSITSSATSENIDLAIRVGGNFTDSLARLSMGTEIYVQGPFGEFVQGSDDRNIVMIAGGIGITPFMSMIRTAAASQFKTPMTLLYSCRVGRDVPFYTELRSIEQTTNALRVILFATNQTSPPNSPRTLSGRMTKQHIEQVTHGEYSDSTYFVCGPSKFISDTEAMLRTNGVADDQIISESFTQSSKVLIGGYNLRKVTYAFATLVLIAGIGSIAALDLSRYVPNHTVAAQTTTVSPASAQSTGGDTTTSTSSTSGSNTGAASTSTNTVQKNSNSASQQSNYQPPVTSVS